MYLVKRAVGPSEVMHRWMVGARARSTCDSGPLRGLLAAAGARQERSREWATQPYAAGDASSAGASRAVEPGTVLLFPGQGAQHVGMGRRLERLPAARRLYELASEVVGWDVWRVCTAGPEDELERRCQTAVLVTSLAALERARDERPAALQRVRAVAGFSLGELAALTYAGALPLDGALRLVELRAAAMRAAAAERAGGMLTVWLAPDAELPRLLDEARAAAAGAGVREPVCVVANYLYPGCRVLAGDAAALAHVERAGRARGVRRAARVRVAGAWHSPLVARAAEAVRAAADALRGELRAPRVRVVSGADARSPRSGAEVAAAVARAVTAPVRWERALTALYARPRGAAFPLTLALGPGAALRATLRQVNARAWDASVQVDV